MCARLCCCCLLCVFSKFVLIMFVSVLSVCIDDFVAFGCVVCGVML